MAVDAEAATASANAAADAAVASSLTGPKLVKRAGGRSTRVNPEIVIHTDQRKGRKQVTIVMGLDLFDIKLADAARACKKAFASGATVAKVRTGGPPATPLEGAVTGWERGGGPGLSVVQALGDVDGDGSGAGERDWEPEGERGRELRGGNGSRKDGGKGVGKGRHGQSRRQVSFSVAWSPSREAPVFWGGPLMPTACPLSWSACAAVGSALGANLPAPVCPVVKPLYPPPPPPPTLVPYHSSAPPPPTTVGRQPGHGGDPGHPRARIC